ncbi:MAG: hypothetical protein QOI63_226 [Thermoplasmata archaeon]|jgi:hypothetical protein|nr:hypothetical protein [Thermoplasmata archaeon]
MAFSVFFSLAMILTVISAKKIDSQSMPYLLGLAFAAFYVFWIANLRFWNMISDVIDRFSDAIAAGVRKLRKKPVLMQEEPSEEASTSERLGRRPKAFFMLDGFITLAACFFVFTLLLLPAIRPSYGGALPRHAYLDIAPTELSSTTLVNAFGANWTSDGNSTTLVKAFGANWTTNGNVLRSPVVTIFFYDSNTLLLKAQGHDEAKDRLMEISRNLVRAITWID